MKKRIAILGSTGSIGRQTLDIVSAFSSAFEVTGLATKGYLDRFRAQIKQFRPKHVSISSDGHDYFAFPEYKTIVYKGPDGLIKLAEDAGTDIVVMSIVGTAGLPATIAAIKKGKTIALASKEVLVAAGDIVMPLAKKHKAPILPLDSEHSAIFQCLEGSKALTPSFGHPSPRGRGAVSETIKRIILTASGGPFRKYSKDQLQKVTAKQALDHPTWNMGPKITIDSATLMNKGLEVIEAHHLFGVPYEKIEVVIHPQSIVHSMVEFVDGAVIAQLGIPDMRLPIQYALNYPERKENNFGSVDFLKIKSLTFEKPDTNKFPCLKLAYKAGETGGTLPAVLSASNDVAVEMFLKDEIKFTDIPNIVGSVMKKHKVIKDPSLSQIIESERWAREEARAKGV